MHLEDDDEPRRRRRGAALEAALLEATWDELIEVGYGALTLDSVAQRAGTSRPVIARRWPTKPDLVRAAVVRMTALGDFVTPDTGSLADDVRQALRQSNEKRASVSTLLVAYLGGYFLETGTNLAQLRDEMIAGRTNRFDEIVDRAIARGEVEPAGLTPRMRSVAFDLYRNEAVMRLGPVPEDVIDEIVDDVFVPLLTRRG
ncbi:TetR/AcrR family transcriptional regulator [Cellulomonas sp. JH27-2]|uniref:TetR/AcrR family transcriptional regulator n=1 Tax=Cellulomonas sp. JH27-2 TaxID=2774139 RepID=UPI00178628C4|nr:TetR/AcrR family transcriptional regulator [Cellulomonas sp. JH27-2]